MAKRRLVAGTCLLVLAASAGTGRTQVQFSSQVDALQFQVVVAGDDGRLVRGLEAGDFRVTVDGARREVIAAYEIDLGEGDVPLPAPGSLPPAGWRQFVLFFDAAFNSPRGVHDAQEAALRFLDEQLAPTDLVSVVTFDVVSGVKVRVPLTRDRQQARAAVEGLGLTQATRVVDRPGFLVQTILGDLVGGTTTDPNASSGPRGEAATAVAGVLATIARAEFSQYQSWVSAYVSQIGKLGEILQVFRGRKHVLFFTTGFEDRVLTGKSLEALAADRARFDSNPGEALATIDPEASFGSAEVRAALEAAIERLRGSDTLLHMIDVSGIGGGRQDNLSRGMRSDSPVSTSSGRSSLTVWAEGTGGSVVWNTNRLSEALAEIERAARHYYVVAISRLPGDPLELSLEVEVDRPGIRVTAAPSRFAPPPEYGEMDDQQRQAQLAELVTKGIERTGMEFDLLAVPFAGRNDIARLALVVEVPWEQLEAIAEVRGDGKVALDLIGYVVTPTETMIDLTDRHVELDLKRLRGGRIEGLPLRLYDLLWAGPGEQTVRLIIRDEKVGMASSVSRPIRVPEPGGTALGIGTPVLLDAAHPGLMMRTFDATAPPEHKADGPVSYPFVAGDQELTPMARPRLEGGEPWELLVTLSNVTRDPLTGQLQPYVMLEIESAGGERSPMQNVTLLGRGDDGTGTGLNLWLRIPDTGGVQPGFYRLVVSARDAISGSVATRALDVRIH